MVDPQQVGSFRDNRGTLLQKLRAVLSTTSLLRAGYNRCECKHPNLPIAADRFKIVLYQTTSAFDESENAPVRPIRVRGSYAPPGGFRFGQEIDE